MRLKQATRRTPMATDMPASYCRRTVHDMAVPPRGRRQQVVMEQDRTTSRLGPSLIWGMAFGGVESSRLVFGRTNSQSA